MSFLINLADSKKEILGLEDDGSAYAELDAQAQFLTSFSSSTISGNYVEFTRPVDSPPTEMDQSEYNGTGNGTWTGSLYCTPAGNVCSVSGTASYTVASDGSVTITYVNNAGGEVLYGGGIDSNGLFIRLAAVTAGRSARIDTIAKQ